MEGLGEQASESVGLRQALDHERPERDTNRPRHRPESERDLDSLSEGGERPEREIEQAI